MFNYCDESIAHEFSSAVAGAIQARKDLTRAIYLIACFVPPDDYDLKAQETVAALFIISDYLACQFGIDPDLDDFRGFL